MQRVCQCCGTADLSHRDRNAKYCLACRNEGQVGRGRILAVRAVNAKVKAGLMPRADTLACVDCGKPAQEWEHRDYARPFDVEPVCRACNQKRGPGMNNFHVGPPFDEPNTVNPDRARTTVYVGSSRGLSAFKGEALDFYATRSAFAWHPAEVALRREIESA